MDNQNLIDAIEIISQTIKLEDVNCTSVGELLWTLADHVKNSDEYKEHPFIEAIFSGKTLDGGLDTEKLISEHHDWIKSLTRFKQKHP